MSGCWGYGTIFRVFLWGYVVGGVTLLPCVFALVWFWGTKPVETTTPNAIFADENEESSGQRSRPDGLTEPKSRMEIDFGPGLSDDMRGNLKGRIHVPDAFAGYFAVCREYVPGGANGKPPDRTTPAGATVPLESPSVYQSMYRSIFDRNRVQGPTIEAANTRNKKTRNMFYVVLRLGHLMLYDNEDQMEVRHVISLGLYKVDVYAGGESIPEGELWIKRNCLRLSQTWENDLPAEAKTFYLFSDNCSEKEDLYHAMLNAQDHHKDNNSAISPPVPLKFETSDLVKLVQQLHASEENLHTRWINALIGRVFLALYRTSRLKDLLTKKINKKISRVPKPAIISSVELRGIDMGTSPPFLTNPKLKELTVDGDLVVETDISYKGNFRVEISATVRIDLGTRFKAREVTIILATVLNRLDGHLLIRMKPPPSNRLWISFETPPKMEMSLEPIVSSRQITYGVVLRAIENRIREVLNETIVLPNWDDTPITDTILQTIRGGIWEESKENKSDKKSKTEQDDEVLESALADAKRLDGSKDVLSPLPVVPDSDPEESTSISTDLKFTPATSRTRQFSSSTAPATLDLGVATSDAFCERDSKTPTSIRSLPLTPLAKSSPRPEHEESSASSSGNSTEDVSAASLVENTESTPAPKTEKDHIRTKSKELSLQEIATAAAAAAEATKMTRKQTLNQSFSSATSAARNWLALKQSQQSNRGDDTRISNDGPSKGDPSSDGARSDTDGIADLPTPTPPRPQTEPMGRGQPLPPPGIPLPLPKMEKRQTWGMPTAASFANLTKKKPVASASALHIRKSKEQLASSPKSTTSIQQADASLQNDEETLQEKSPMMQKSTSTLPQRSSAKGSPNPDQSPPLLPKRRQHQQSPHFAPQNRRLSRNTTDVSDGQENLMVIEAPVADGSPPSSPVKEDSDVLDREHNDKTQKPADGESKPSDIKTTSEDISTLPCS